MYNDAMKEQRGEDEEMPLNPKVKPIPLDYKDLIKTIDWNERRYMDKARAAIKRGSILN